MNTTKRNPNSTSLVLFVCTITTLFQLIPISELGAQANAQNDHTGGKSTDMRNFYRPPLFDQDRYRPDEDDGNCIVNHQHSFVGWYWEGIFESENQEHCLPRVVFHRKVNSFKIDQSLPSRVQQPRSLLIDQILEVLHAALPALEGEVARAATFTRVWPFKCDHGAIDEQDYRRAVYPGDFYAIVNTSLKYTYKEACINEAANTVLGVLEEGREYFEVRVENRCPNLTEQRIRNRHGIQDVFALTTKLTIKNTFDGIEVTADEDSLDDVARDIRNAFQSECATQGGRVFGTYDLSNDRFRTTFGTF